MDSPATTILLYVFIGFFTSFLRLGLGRTASRICKPQSKPDLTKYDEEILKRKHNGVAAFALSSFFWLLPILIYTTVQFFSVIGTLYATKYATGAVFFIPDTIREYWVPAIFLGLLLWGASTEIIFDLYRISNRINPEEWRAYRFILERSAWGGYEIDNKILSAVFAVIVLAGTLPAFFLAMDSYTRITDSAIVINSYLSLREKTSRFSDVKKILLINRYRNAVSGAVEPTSRYYSVVFADGSTWDTLNLSIGNSPKEEAVIEYIASKSGVPVVLGIHNIDDK
jgi:hypothetical protein